MHVIAERDLGSPINDLVAVPEGLLVTLLDGRVLILDDRLATVRTLRGMAEEGDLFTNGIVAIDDVAVLVGWEMVDALDLATGEARWTIADGDHSIDESYSDCLVYAPPYAMLPNGMCVDVRDGEYVPWDESPGEHDAALADRDAILVGMPDGAIMRWTREQRAELARMASGVVAIQRAENDELLVACRDGSVHFADRCVLAPSDGEVWHASVALGPQLAVLQSLSDSWRLVVDGKVVDRGTSRWGRNHVAWLGSELVAVAGGMLGEMPAAISRVIGEHLVVGSASSVRVLAA